MNWYLRAESWSLILRKYLPRLTLCSLIWEIVQLPLYTISKELRWKQLAFNVAHCTVGDTMIGTIALVLALTLCRAGKPTNWHRTKVGIVAIVIAVAYTVLSERINLARGSWSYSIWMPILPWFEVGLSPIVQWLVVPFVAWRWANRQNIQMQRFKRGV